MKQGFISNVIILRKMKYLTTEHIRQHLRIDAVDEDAVLELYGSAAEDTILNMCNRTIDDVIEQYGCVPDPIRQATLLLVGISYQHREPATATNISIIPYGNIDILIRPYIRLADGCTKGHDVQTAILGSDVKIEFTADLPDGLEMTDVDFTAIVYNETAIDRKKQYPKAECILTDTGSYVVLVDTEDLGVGQLMLRVVFHIPDTDYPSGYRKEVVKINPYTRIIG